MAQFSWNSFANFSVIPYLIIRCRWKIELEMLRTDERNQMTTLKCRTASHSQPKEYRLHSFVCMVYGLRFTYMSYPFRYAEYSLKIQPIVSKNVRAYAFAFIRIRILICITLYWYAKYQIIILSPKIIFHFTRRNKGSHIHTHTRTSQYI